MTRTAQLPVGRTLAVLAKFDEAGFDFFVAGRTLLNQFAYIVVIRKVRHGGEIIAQLKFFIERAKSRSRRSVLSGQAQDPERLSFCASAEVEAPSLKVNGGT